MDHCLWSTIGYGPLFPKSHTDPDMVQASLDYLISHINHLGQQTIVTADQATYDIVKDIVANKAHI